MLAILDTIFDQCAVNLIPCRIQHTGPTKITKRYWTPSPISPQETAAYFRGRRLKGTIVKLPDTMQGIILRKSDKTILEPRTAIAEESNEVEQRTPVVEKISTFASMTFYGHDMSPTDDNMINSITEWLDLAEAIHTGQ